VRSWHRQNPGAKVLSALERRIFEVIIFEKKGQNLASTA
jgi:hypothetical protein